MGGDAWNFVKNQKNICIHELYTFTVHTFTVISAFGEIIKLLDDHGVSTDGIAVYGVAYQVQTTYSVFPLKPVFSCSIDVNV